MNKGAILSLLFAGLITGSYLEFQVNQSDAVADPQVIQAIDVPAEPSAVVEPSPFVTEQLVSRNGLVIVHRPRTPPNLDLGPAHK